LRNRRARFVATAWVVGALFSAGCSASYNGERLFWKAQHVSHDIIKDPTHATPEQLAKAIQAYELVTRKTPQTVWAAQAYVSIGSFYAIGKQYDKARDAYRMLLQNYAQYQELCERARLAIAMTFEAEQKWDDANKAYYEVADYHPWTKLGLEAPLYVAVSHQKRQEAEKATRAYERAVRIYLKLLPNAPNPEMAAQVKAYLSLAYQHLEEWEQAARLLEELLPIAKPEGRPLILMTIGSIYEKKLHDPRKAQEVYTKLATEFPDHPFGKAAKTQLGQLGVSVPPVNPSIPATR